MAILAASIVNVWRDDLLMVHTVQKPLSSHQV